MSNLKLYLDDMRPIPEGYMGFRPQNGDLPMFYHLARHADEISFDHDMGLDWPTGYEVLSDLEKEVIEGRLWTCGAPFLKVHSANPVGMERMRQVIANIYAKVGYKQ